MTKQLLRLILHTFESKLHFFLLLCAIAFSALLDIGLVGMIIPLSIVVLDLESTSFQFLSLLDLNSETLMLIFAALLLLKLIFQLTLHWYVYNHFFKYYRKTAEGIANSHFINIERVADNEAGLATEMTSELEELTKTVLIPGMFLFSEFLFITSLALALCFISFQVFFAFFFVIVILFIVFKKIGSNRLNNIGLSTRQSRLTLIDLAKDFYIINSEIVSQGTKDFFIKRLHLVLEKFSKASIWYQFFLTAPRSFIELVGLSFLLVLFIVVQSAGNDDGVAIAAAFSVGLLRILPSVQRLGVYLSQIQFGWRSVGLVDRLNKHDEKKIFKNICSFDSQNIVLKINPKNCNLYDISFQHGEFLVKKGVTILAGRSGLGKSTLMDSIASDLIIKDHLISFTRQDTSLVHGSVLENITLGREVDINFLKEVVNKLFSKSEILEWSQNGFLEKEAISIGGQGLSGGQKQRVSIARALVSDRKIILLDEALSNLNKNRVEEVTDFLNEWALKNNKIILIIAHNIENSKVKIVDLF
jgi:ABC-type multidrug transport system fused ATPase/permease subunit